MRLMVRCMNLGYAIDHADANAQLPQENRKDLELQLDATADDLQIPVATIASTEDFVGELRVLSEDVRTYEKASGADHIALLLRATASRLRNAKEQEVKAVLPQSTEGPALLRGVYNSVLKEKCSADYLQSTKNAPGESLPDTAPPDIPECPLIAEIPELAELRELMRSISNEIHMLHVSMVTLRVDHDKMSIQVEQLQEAVRKTTPPWWLAPLDSPSRPE